MDFSLFRSDVILYVPNFALLGMSIFAKTCSMDEWEEKNCFSSLLGFRAYWLDMLVLYLDFVLMQYSAVHSQGTKGPLFCVRIFDIDSGSREV